MDTAWLLIIIPAVISLFLGGFLWWLKGKEIVDLSNEQENRD